MTTGSSSPASGTGVERMFSLRGRRALVTGARTGIGAAVAVALAEAGADLVLWGRTTDGMRDVVDAVRATGRDVDVVAADLADPRNTRALAEDVVSRWDIDVLVNDAGTIRREDAVETDWEDWRHVLAVDLDAVWVLTQVVGRSMLARRSGRIVTVASLLSFQGGVRVPAYAAAKHRGRRSHEGPGERVGWGRGHRERGRARYVDTDNTAALRADPERSAAILEPDPGRPLGSTRGPRGRRRLPGLARRGVRQRPRAGRRRWVDGAVTHPAAMRQSAIAKVAAVVEALAEHRSTTEIARATDLPTSTVHRILQELVAVGWAREDHERGYLLGARLLTLAGRASDHGTLTRIARPFLQALSDGTGHAVHLAVRTGDEAVYVDKLEGTRSYHMRSRVGLVIPMHCTAIGKAVLAALPDAEVRSLLGRTGTPRRTPNTLTTRERVVAHLAGVRSRGYSVDDEENELQTRCIGAVVRDHRGEPLGGLSLSMLAFRARRRAHQGVLAPRVVQAASEVTQALGGR